MIRFYLSLYAGKLFLVFARLFHKERSDKVAFLVDRICPRFLEYVSKPKDVIFVTGTNGKTTVTSFIAQGLKLNNKSVLYNDWGANLYSGHIRCFLDAVNILNKPVIDSIVLECDEVTINKTTEKIKPNYVVVTNVCRDSIRRNAYPEYIKNKLDKAFDGLDDTVFILNADDPLSSFICKKSKNKYFVSVNKLSEEARENSANDFTCCPKCNGKIKYIYRHYRHIGKFKCTECGFESIESNYKVTKVDYDNSLITLDKNDYKLVSPTIFNVYNESLAIVFFKLYGLNDDEIKDLFNNINVPESRENVIEVNGYKIHMQLAKGQNGSACSTVFESLVKDNKPKRLILILDEDYSSHNVSDAEETITWFYDTDYEFLNNDCIKQIIIPSKLKYDYMLRLKMAGIDEAKFNCIDDYKEAYKEIDLNKKSDIYILYEVDDRPLGLEVLDSLVKEIEGDNE